MINPFKPKKNYFSHKLSNLPEDTPVFPLKNDNGSASDDLGDVILDLLPPVFKANLLNLGETFSKTKTEIVEWLVSYNFKLGGLPYAQATKGNQASVLEQAELDWCGIYE